MKSEWDWQHLKKVRIHFLNNVFSLLPSINFASTATWRNDFSLLSVKAILPGGNSYQPAADHILERFEIFGSMVRLLNGSISDCSVVQSAVNQVLSCRASLSLRSNMPFCFVLVCVEIVVHRMFTVFLNGLNGKNSSRSIVRNISLVYLFILV